MTVETTLPRKCFLASASWQAVDFASFPESASVANFRRPGKCYPVIPRFFFFFFMGSMITKQWISVDLGWSFNTSGDFMNMKLSISPKWPEVWSTSSQRVQGGRRGGHRDFGCTYWWSSKQLGMATWIGGSSWEDLKLQEMGRIFTTQSWL